MKKGGEIFSPNRVQATTITERILNFIAWGGATTVNHWGQETDGEAMVQHG